VHQVLHGTDPAAQERRLHWRVALELFRQRPWLGAGYGCYRILSLERLSPEWYTQSMVRTSGMLLPGYVHNEYLQLLADDGAIGGLLFLGLLGTFYWLTIGVCLRAPDAPSRQVGLGLLAAVTALAFQSCFGVTFRQTSVVMLFWV